MVTSNQRNNPFPGLRPFELDEEHLFFGREGQADELLRRLNRNRFLAVVGTSGSGKSSLVRAGLLPSLYSGFLSEASSLWRVTLLRPGNAPVRNLAEALNHPDVFGVDPGSDDAVIRVALTESTLRRGALGLVEIVQQARMGEHENLLVVVDQFEELFRFKQQAQTLNQGLQAEDEAAAFVKLLLAAKSQAQVPIYIVLTMRSDFLGDCAQFRDLPETLNDSQYLVPRLTRDQLQKAVEGPVAVGGATITPRLVNRLLNDTGDSPDQLPILQHALMRTWDYWSDQQTPEQPIDLPHYEAIGTMARALSIHADQVYAGLSCDRDRLITSKLFRCLTDRGPDNREIRRPTQLDELCAVAEATPEEMIAVIDQYRDARRSFLMPPLSVPLSEDSIIDISHESLMRNWKRLNEWVSEETQSALIYRRLAETAAMHGQGQAGYLRDPELTIGLTWQREQHPNAAWANRYAPNFNEAIAFLQSSAEAGKAEALEKENIKRREINRLRSFLLILGGLCILAGSTSVYAFSQKKQAETQTALANQMNDEALVQRFTAEKQRKVALEQGQKAEAQRKLAVKREQEAKTAKAEADKQKQQAQAAQKSEASQRQRAEGALKRAEAGEAEAQRQAQNAQEQKDFAVQSERLARAATAQANKASINAEVNAQSLAVENFMFSSLHFKALLSATGLNKFVKQREQELTPAAYLQAVSVLREATYFDDWTEHNTLQGHTDDLIGVAFSPDGKTIASAGADHDIKLWNTSGHEIQSLQGHTDSVNRIVFNRAGNLIASSSQDGTVRLWGPSGQALKTLEGHLSWVTALSISPDGRVVASGDGTGTIRLWNIADSLAVDSSPFLEEQGQLTPGGLFQERETFFKEHSFEAQAGQNILIRLESDDFDTYLLLLDQDGVVLAESDDSFGTDSHLNTVIPKTAVYRIIVTSYEAEEQGSYTLSAQRGFNEVAFGNQRVATYGLSFSPDGRYLASADEDGTARLWDLEGNLVQIFENHVGGLNNVYFSPDGKTLATTSDDTTAQLWPIAAEMSPPLVLLQVTGQLTELSASDETGRFFAEHTFEGKAGQRVSIRLESSDFDTYLKLLDGDGQIIAENDDLSSTTNSSLSVTLAQDAVYRVVATSYAAEEQGQYDLAVRTGFPEPGAVLRGHISPVRGLSFSPDASLIVTSSNDGTLRLWNSTGRELQVLKGHVNYVNDVSFSPDGSLIASGSGDNTLKLWKRGSQGLKTLDQHDDSLWSVVYSPDGQLLATAGSDRKVRLWSRDGNLLTILEGHNQSVRNVSFSPDGQTLASASSDGTIKLWNRNGQPLQTFSGQGFPVNDVSFSPDGRTLASGGDNGEVRLWTRGGQVLKSFAGHEKSINSVSFSPDGKILASASDDGRVKLWDLARQEEILSIPAHTDVILDVSFSPDGQTFASAGGDGAAKLWDRSGKLLQTLQGHTNWVRSVTFSRDGQTIATASNDHTVKLWDASSGYELQTLEGHTDFVLGVAFSPDGKTLASASGDRTVILWNFDLEDLLTKSCDRMSAYMANPATPAEEKALCADVPSQSPASPLSLREWPRRWGNLLGWMMSSEP